jgi:hypothetical protein
MGDAGGPESDRAEVGRESAEMAASGFATAPFELVTAETRAAILGALATYQAGHPTEPSVAFADLRERAGVEDSGNFNYHLEKLRPAFVRRTDEGYALTNAGMSLAGTLRAGVGAETTRGPVALDATCGICGTELAASYEDGFLSVACENDHTYPHESMPPNAVEGRTLREAVDLLTRQTKHNLELVREGVCPACFDDVEREYNVLDAPRASHIVAATCSGCGRVSASPVGMYVLDEPAVVAFYHDHGVDVTETPLWALELSIVEPTVRSEEPLRLSLSVERDGERLTLVVDEHANLLDSNRSRGDA